MDNGLTERLAAALRQLMLLEPVRDDGDPELTAARAWAATVLKQFDDAAYRAARRQDEVI